MTSLTRRPDRYGIAAQKWILNGSMAFSPALFIGLWLTHHLPPAGAGTSAEHIARMMNDHHTQVQIGGLLLMMGGVTYGTFGAVRSYWIWRMEPDGSFPWLTVVSIITVAADTACTLITCTMFAVVGFRAGDISPDSVQALNDMTMFLILFITSPMILECILFAVAIFNDRSVPRIFPRWLAWLTIGAAVFVIPASLIGFTKTGAFAWNGFMGFWVPIVAFGIWANALNLLVLNAIKRDEAALESGESDPVPTAVAVAATTP